MDQDRFADTHLFFLTHIDQLWSFTDCFSFIVMTELKQKKALTKDNYFQDIAFTALLIDT